MARSALGCGTLLVVGVMCASADAGPVWTASTYFHGSNAGRAEAYTSDGAGGSSLDYDLLNAVGDTGNLSATQGGNTVSNDYAWSAMDAMSTFGITADGSGGAYTTYLTASTEVDFVANVAAQYEISLGFDWVGNGQKSVQLYAELYDGDLGGTVWSLDQPDSSGGDAQLSIGHTGTLIAGHTYKFSWYAQVTQVQFGGDYAGSGTGGGGISLAVVPLPSASAVAGVGLLGLCARRRRGSF